MLVKIVLLTFRMAIFKKIRGNNFGGVWRKDNPHKLLGGR